MPGSRFPASRDVSVAKQLMKRGWGENPAWPLDKRKKIAVTNQISITLFPHQWNFVLVSHSGGSTWKSTLSLSIANVC